MDKVLVYAPVTYLRSYYNLVQRRNTEGEWQVAYSTLCELCANKYIYIYKSLFSVLNSRARSEPFYILSLQN